MPSLENAVPLQNQNALMRREMRSRKLLRYLQATEVSQIAMSLRRESKAWSRKLEACMSLGVAGIDAAEKCQRSLMSARHMMLEIIGMPKRPARPVLTEQTAREIRDAMPEEILIDELPVSGPTPEIPMDRQACESGR